MAGQFLDRVARVSFFNQRGETERVKPSLKRVDIIIRPLCTFR